MPPRRQGQSQPCAPRAGTEQTLQSPKGDQPQGETQQLGFYTPQASPTPNHGFLALCPCVVVSCKPQEAAGPGRGRGSPGPFPDHLQANLRYGKTSERDKHSEEWGKSNKVTLLRWQPLPNLQTIRKLFIYKIIKISCPLLPYHLASAGLLVPCTPCSGEILEPQRRWLEGAAGPQQGAGHTRAPSPRHGLSQAATQGTFVTRRVTSIVVLVACPLVW